MSFFIVFSLCPADDRSDRATGRAPGGQPGSTHHSPHLFVPTWRSAGIILLFYSMSLGNPMHFHTRFISIRFFLSVLSPNHFCPKEEAIEDKGEI